MIDVVGKLNDMGSVTGNLNNAVAPSGEAIEQFDTYLLFPNVGKSSILYVDQGANKAYRWDEETLKYYVVGSDYLDIKIINGGNANG